MSAIDETNDAYRQGREDARRELAREVRRRLRELRDEWKQRHTRTDIEASLATGTYFGLRRALVELNRAMRATRGR